MAEMLAIIILGAVIGGGLSGGSFWLQHKWDDEEKARTAQKAADEKDRLSPKMRVRLWLDPDNLQGPYKPPLKRYRLYLENMNQHSVPVLKFSLEFNFKNVVAEVHPRVLLAPGDESTTESREIFLKKKDGSEVYYQEEPHHQAIAKKFTFDIHKVDVNKKQVNLNLIEFYVEKWEERNSAFTSQIIVDFSKQPHIPKNSRKAGTYYGIYSYVINGQEYSQRVQGPIPDSPPLRDEALIF